MNLKKLRKERKLTQKDMSEFLNTSANNYGKYENGKLHINEETLVKLADYFDVSLDYLCGRKYSGKVGYLPEEKVEVVNNLLALEEKDFVLVKVYIQALLDSKK